MSRYSKIVDKVEYAWGFDEPLSEYFVQAFKLDAEPHEEDVIWSVSSHNTLNPHPKCPGKYTYTNSEIMQLIKDENVPVPEEHMKAIAGDLPF